MWVHRVLCPIDYSEQSGRVLRHAAALAASYGAELHVLHVLGPRLAPDVGLLGVFVPVFLADGEADPERTLRTFVDTRRLPVAATCVVRTGATPYRDIAAYADQMHADLIVLGTHGYTGVDHVVLGSTAERLVHHAPCPVLVVPRDADEPGAQDRVHFTSVLCAIDFSPGSLAAWAHAVSIVHQHRARLTLLHVIESVSDGDVRRQADHGVGEYLAAGRQELLDRLDGLIFTPLRACGRVSTLVEVGRPAPLILEVADARQADLIVMGAQGHGGLGLMLFGSATQGVLRHATCPVLTARGTIRSSDVASVRAYARAAV
jgi:nucleotide-binding universal stress UspA family protein